MSYKAFARKWRPQNLSNVVGQDRTVASLKYILDSKSLHHAYLFHGIRGIGKTTLARILAKSLNCLDGVNSNPCNKCIACQEATYGNCNDIIEVDAASRTKVEDTRELIENIAYLPTKARYKVYIIDEVHMLSGHSFNALLKTLEEPPNHIIFILATTDIHKIPATILSRCLQFPLLPIPELTIHKHLTSILQSEGIPFTKESLYPITNAAAGSLRDALSLLERAVAYGNKKLEYLKVIELLGITDDELLIELLKSIISKAPNDAFQIISKLSSENVDFNWTLVELNKLIHNVALAEMVPESLPRELPNKEKYLKLAGMVSPDALQLYYQIGITAQKDILYGPSSRQVFEMAILRMISFMPMQYGLNSATKLGRQDFKIAVPTNTTNANAINIAPKNKEIIVDKKNWVKIITDLKLSGILKIIADNCITVDDNGTTIKCTLPEKYKNIVHRRYEEILSQRISHHINRKVKIIINTKDNTNSTHPQQTADSLEKQNIRKLIAEDLNVQQIIKELGVTLHEISNINS